MAILTIAGTAVKSPSKMISVIRDVSGRIDRNAAGTTVIDRIAQKRDLECEWAYLTNAEIETILTKAGESSTFFTVYYYDAQDNANKTITCYVLERSMGVQRYSGTTPVGWENVKITFREQ